ncbi:MAG: nuclear transport factor 2 family protein [Gemmatimonadota bacterium]|nr:MAG: nuclear transport factor 2 family protein [Gemmatimonadota bacterium]
MGRVIVALVIGVGIAFPGRAVAQQSSEDEVIAVVEAVFAGMAAGDTEVLRSIMLSESKLLSMGERGPSWRTGTSFAEAFERSEGPVVERMWDPVVMIDGPIASLWAPYDLYFGDRWSHCGTDSFQLALTEDGWKVAFISYSVAQPPACERHPKGPPGPK